MATVAGPRFFPVCFTCRALLDVATLGHEKRVKKMPGRRGPFFIGHLSCGDRCPPLGMSVDAAHARKERGPADKPEREKKMATKEKKDGATLGRHLDRHVSGMRSLGRGKKKKEKGQAPESSCWRKKVVMRASLLRIFSPSFFPLSINDLLASSPPLFSSSRAPIPNLLFLRGRGRKVWERKQKDAEKATTALVAPGPRYGSRRTRGPKA